MPSIAPMPTILYFAALVAKPGRASEELGLPETLHDARTLLAWLRMRGQKWEHELMDRSVTLTVNKQFAVADTKIDNDAEIAIVSKRPW
jgi:molybdopterin converting factor small subunit